MLSLVEKTLIHRAQPAPLQPALYSCRNMLDSSKITTYRTQLRLLCPLLEGVSTGPEPPASSSIGQYTVESLLRVRGRHTATYREPAGPLSLSGRLLSRSSVAQWSMPCVIWRHALSQCVTATQCLLLSVPLSQAYYLLRKLAMCSTRLSWQCCHVADSVAGRC